MATFVIDASVAVKWVVTQSLSDKAKVLLATSITRNGPEPVLGEVGVALSREAREGLLEHSAARKVIPQLNDFFSVLFPIVDLLDEAMRLSLEIHHPLFDCDYLALAIGLDVPMITADQKFASRLAGTPFEPHVVHLGAWSGMSAI